MCAKLVGQHHHKEELHWSMLEKKYANAHAENTHTQQDRSSVLIKLNYSRLLCRSSEQQSPAHRSLWRIRRRESAGKQCETNMLERQRQKGQSLLIYEHEYFVKGKIWLLQRDFGHIYSVLAKVVTKDSNFHICSKWHQRLTFWNK